jgi:hypothetical protein
MKMTLGSKARKSKHGLTTLAVGEARVFDTPTERDKDLLRRAAHNQNERTERRYMTRSLGDKLIVTRLR